MDPTENRQSISLLHPKESKGPRECSGCEVGEVEATATTSGDVSVGGILSSPQSAKKSSSPPIAMGSVAGSSSVEGSDKQAREVANPLLVKPRKT